MCFHGEGIYSALCITFLIFYHVYYQRKILLFWYICLKVNSKRVQRFHLLVQTQENIGILLFYLKYKLIKIKKFVVIILVYLWPISVILLEEVTTKAKEKSQTSKYNIKIILKIFASLKKCWWNWINYSCPPPHVR